MKSGLLLNVVVTQGTTILELLSSKDQTLLIGGNTLLVLDLGLDVVNGIRRLNVEGDGLSSQGLDKDLHTSTKTEDEVESGLLLDVVVTQGTTILELLTSKDQTLLIRRDSFLVLDLGLDVVNGIRRLDVKSDGLASQGLDKDLHGGVGVGGCCCCYRVVLLVVCCDCAVVRLFDKSSAAAAAAAAGCA